MSDATERELSLTATNTSSGCACCSPSTEANQEPVVASVDQESNAYQVAGMTCGHCVASVKEELLKLPGVNSVAIDLTPGGLSTVTVFSKDPVNAETVRASVAAAGYEMAPS